MAAPPLGACPAGTALASFDLDVVGEEGAKSPLRSAARLDTGTVLRYTPREVFGSKSEDAEVALISIPTTPTGVLGVLEEHKATEAGEWFIPSRAAAVALVYAPQGLKLGKVTELMRRDPELIPQLATYAEKSAQTEMLMETVSAWERAGSSQSLQAALSGFSSRYGLALPALNRTATTDQQALTLMQALHPALSAFDPLSPSPASRLQQSGSLAAAVAGLFFGSPVGLATAGGAMFLNMRSMLFPGSEFRSALAQQMGEATVLCAKREAAKSRTKIVYLWAWKIQGAPPPRLEGLPYRANLGSPVLTVPLKGSHFENVRAVRTQREGTEVEFLPSPPTLSLKLPPEVKKGDKLDLRIEVEDFPAPIVVPGAIELLDPRPVVASVEPSMPTDLPVQLQAGELPANAFIAATIRTSGAGALPTMHLECTDPQLTLRKLSIRPGEPGGAARLRAVSAGEWFLSFEPGAVGQPPCEVAVRVETGDGLSDPVPAGHLVRLPRIGKFSLTRELVGEATYSGWLEGEELQSIARTGWDGEKGVDVSGPPLPVAQDGSRQRLKIAMPWPPPAPHAALYVWLRGEERGRRSAVSY